MINEKLEERDKSKVDEGKLSNLSQKSNSERILVDKGCRYYLLADGFCQFPNESYPKDRKEYHIAFLDMSKLSPQQRDGAFIELADQHLQEGRDIEAEAEEHFQRWGGFMPAQPESYVSAREAFVAEAATALINLVPIMFANPGTPPSPSEFPFKPKVALQSLENSQRDLVATYSYSLRRYHDAIGCYIAIAPESRPPMIRERIGEIVSAAERIKNKVPKDIASICEDYIPTASRLASWIETKAKIVLDEIEGTK